MIHSSQFLRSSNLLLTVIVLLAIAAVAYTDSMVETHVSLAYLYLLPLVLSALVHRLRFSLLLVIACAILRDLFDPFPSGGRQSIVRDLMIVVGFSTVVVLVNWLSRQRGHLSELVRAQRDELAREMQLAAHVQARLLPQKAPVLDGYELAGRMIPASLVAGDYYDFIDLPERRVGLVIADVCGKGVAAGLLMAGTQVALRLAVQSSSPIVAAVSAVNRAICELTDNDKFVSMFYGRLDLGKRLLEYVNAGHHPPILYRAASGDVITLETGGCVLGLFPEAEYQTSQVRLQANDIIIFYTDGLVEAHNEDEEEYSRERLISLVRTHAADSAEALVEVIYRSVAQFTGMRDLQDDLTLIVSRVLERQ